jgi:hypothetical protein
MAVSEKESSFVAAASETINLSQMFAVTGATGNPAYLVVTALDRDEYTAGATGATGSFTGNGHTLKFSSLGGDGRGAGIVFTYQASTGRYYNSTYGYFDQLTYTSSGSAGDVTDIAVFGTSNLFQATAYAGNPYAMMQSDPSGTIGTATVATVPHDTATVPSQATPDSIAAVADSFVGDAWNRDGCWTLASTIAAEAGAAIPIQSTETGLAGQANGEWIVAFNGPAGQTGNWESMVTAGEMIVFVTASGGGHITTCVSGSGGTAMLVDNATFETASGTIENLANDGSSSDIIIQAAHAASQEWAGVSASSVVIYELDTPVVTAKVVSDQLAALATLSLGALFAATDPGGKTVTEWQVYDTAAGDSLVEGGTDYSDHTAASALTATSLSLVSLLAGSAATTDTLEVRAYNGTYWGDWDALSVAVVASAPPVLAAQTAAQTWLGGKAFTLALPAGTFTDPGGLALSYSAQLAGGGALPSWLKFNAATDTFSGTAPSTAQTLSITVTATDTNGLSVADTFQASVAGVPTVTDQTANQTWTEGKAVSLALPANTFTDPQGEALSYTATLAGGAALPSWLTFNAATDTFTGTAPAAAESLGITVTATDTSGLAASENFTASVQAPVTAVKPAVTVTAQTPNQTWSDGQVLNFALPSDTFTDALGLKMTFAAYQVSGPEVTSWLRFNSATDTFSGTVPAGATGTIGLAVIATDAQHASAEDFFEVTIAGAPSSHTGTVAASGFFDPTTPAAAAIALLSHF